MNKNIMIILLLVAAVAVVVVAAVAFTGGDDNKGSDTDGPPLKDTLAVGDYYKTKNDVSLDIMGTKSSETVIETAKIIKIDGDKYTVEASEGDVVETKVVTREQFLENIYCSDVENYVKETLEQLNQMTGGIMTFEYNVKKTGTEVIDTPFGKVKCDVYDVKVTGAFEEPMTGSANVTIKLWMGCKNSVIYKAEESADISAYISGTLITSLKMDVDITLTETNLFVEKA